MNTFFGECSIIDKTKIEEIREKLKNIEKSRIFNLDETALFWKCFPNKSIGTKKAVAKNNIRTE